METLLYDKRKRGYRLSCAPEDSATPHVLNIFGRKWWWSKERRVGYVYIGWEEAGTLHLYDIHIEEHYRNQGVGSALLLQVITLARQQGIHRVVGRIVRLDVRTTPTLTDWYRKRGFIVEDVAPDDPINTKSASFSSALKKVRKERNPGSTVESDTQTLYRLTLRLDKEVHVG